MADFEQELLALLGDGVWQYAVVSTEKISFEDDVIEACKRNYCGRYGKSWTCPPGNGDQEVIRTELKSYSNAFVFTTKHPLEDSFDVEGMAAAAKEHEMLNEKIAGFCRERDAKLLGAGGCRICEKCTYPDAPCRFPDRATSSVEACGINVMRLSETAGINYINGANTVTYFTAVFFGPLKKKITVCDENGEKVIFARENSLLVDALAENGIPVPASCGRKGTCGKCRVKVVSGVFGEETADRNGTVRSCRAVVTDDAVIAHSFSKGSGLTDYTNKEQNQKGICGIAVDIGTTTVAASLLLPDGSVRSCSRLNPQSSFGADVINRIDACSKGSLPELTRLIRECVNDMIRELRGEERPEELIIAGNATMLHIFCGVSPVSMGTYPFTPVFTEVRHPDPAELGTDIPRVTVLPSVSAFVGSDITAGIYALGLHKTERTAFLADLGTNGELVFSDRGKLLCTSTAAGPALEGACIECGIGGVPGAIDRVYKENGKTVFTTIGGKEPCGICGAGIVDAVALMLEDEAIDETGFLEDGRYAVSENVYISQQDIRQFQLAKSAVCSGIETLLEKTGNTEKTTDEVYIAGGLGYYMDPGNAVRSGLLPRFAVEKIKAAGNTSLQGALMCIGSPQAVEAICEIAESCQQTDLGGEPAFNSRFTEHMFFD